MLESLSHILLKHILDYLDSNLDRICLLLSCKKLFEAREKILCFNDIYLTILDSEKYYNFTFKLNSFKSILYQSIVDSKNNNNIKNENDNSYEYCFENKNEILNLNKYEERFNCKKYSINIRSLTLGKYNEDIRKGDLDFPHLEYLKLGNTFCSHIEKGALPFTLKFLCLGGITDPLPEQLPDSLEHLEIGNRFNHVIEQPLPRNLITLKFGSLYNQALAPGILPPSLKLLHFGYYFNSKISQLPNQLESIEFGYCYNQRITRCGLEIPESVRDISGYIKFFRVNRYGDFPSTVINLHLHTNYRKITLRRGFFGSDHVLFLNDLTTGAIINSLQADEILLDQSQILRELNHLDHQLESNEVNSIMDLDFATTDQWFNHVDLDEIFSSDEDIDFDDLDEYNFIQEEVDIDDVDQDDNDMVLE